MCSAALQMSTLFYKSFSRHPSHRARKLRESARLIRGGMSGERERGFLQWWRWCCSWVYFYQIASPLSTSFCTFCFDLRRKMRLSFVRASFTVEKGRQQLHLIPPGPQCPLRCAWLLLFICARLAGQSLFVKLYFGKIIPQSSFPLSEN